MGKIVDVQGLYNVGKAMGRGETKDYRQQDAMMNMIGGQILGMLGNAFNKRAAMRKENSKTITNATINLEEGGYDQRMLDQATSVVEQGKKDLYKASKVSIFKPGKGTEMVERTNRELKNLQGGMDWVKDKVDVWSNIYKDGTYKDPKGNSIKVSVNPASSVESQELASSFADGSIYDNMKFQDGQWGLMVVDEELSTDQVTKRNFVPLDKLELPELDESKIVLDFEKQAATSTEERGYKSQDGNFEPFREDAREGAYDQYAQMTYNQISSRFFNKSSDGSYPALDYLMQEGGFSIGGEKFDAIKDPADLSVSAEEQIRRQNIATTYLEMFKQDDLQSQEKINFLVDTQFMPQVEEKFKRGFDSRPAKEEKVQEYKSAYSQGEVARIDKRNLAENNFNTFMNPKLETENKKVKSQLPPNPQSQIEWVVNNLNRNANIKYNPTDDDGNQMNGFYTVEQYEGQDKEGNKAIVNEYKLINRGDKLNFNNLGGILDYNQMALPNRMIKK